MADTQHPEWIADGEKVAVRSRGGFSVAQVKRHTATQVIVEMRGLERRFRANRGGVYEEVGGGDTWHSADRLMPLDHPEVIGGLACQKVDQAFSKLVTATDQLTRAYRGERRGAQRFTEADLAGVRQALDTLAEAIRARDAKLAATDTTGQANS